MFMDEIDYVRLNALTSLCKIGNRGPITFDTEQLQIALGVLEDADRDVREAAHRMLEYVLASGHYCTVLKLQVLNQVLTACLSRFV